MSLRNRLPLTNRRYLDLLSEGVVLFDGATGTQLATYAPTAEDFGGAGTAGLNEMLLFHRPDLVEAVHRAYLEAGARVIKTNTFRGNPLTLGEFGVGGRAYEVNVAAAALARRAADEEAERTGISRLVAGSMGPTGRLPSLNDPDLAAPFDLLAEAFALQAQGLLEGGVDLLLLETQQDLLEVKAAVRGVTHAFDQTGARVPLQAQVTLDAAGRMLTGPDVEAVVATLAALPVDVIGINCSIGPEEMREAVRRLLALSNRPVSVMPNAGMPQNVDGCAVYAMAPEPFAQTVAEFVGWGVAAVGGCCGTGPEHVRALHRRLEGQGRREGVGAPEALPYLASNVTAVALHQEPRPLIVGERVNTQGSRKARRLVLEERYDALLLLAEAQVAYGAHVLDVAVALTERDDEVETMERVVRLLALNSPAPLMIDTTDLTVMRRALEAYPGRPVLNSVNLEAGEGRAREVLALARDFGAAVVALTIDEEGMARSAERKLAVARRLYELAVEAVGLPPHALIFDPLTFTLATGEGDAAVETLEALRRIKAELPGALTNLGVSNVSYGLRTPARRALNSVFLTRAVEAGLDLAIVNPAGITPYPEIHPEALALADDLILARRPDALPRFVAYFEGAEEVAEAPEDEAPAVERLREAILHRRREGVEELVDAAVAEEKPLAVLNDVLLPAMREVGERFGTGELILPFVLRSAEVMRAAVSRLEGYLESAAGGSQGTVVLATVFGDVHDIGKNLVRTILANNGYEVHDLGKQVPVDAIVDAVAETGADAVGLSALLVSTSKQMGLVVAELHRRGLRVPVLVGGAAVNPAFARRIAVTGEGELYSGGVHYCADAFEALRVLDEVVGPREGPPPSGELCPIAHVEEDGPGEIDVPYVASALHPGVKATLEPPFWGGEVVDLPLDELLPLLDRKALFRVGWGARGATGERWEELRTGFEARLAEMWDGAGAYLNPRAAYGYFPAHREGDDLVVYDPALPQVRREVARFSFPRQPSGEGLSLVDYFLPVGSDALDVAAFQVVTVGPGATERFAALEAKGEVSEAYFVHGLAAHVAEAAAEYVHREVRRELGLEPGQGRRYSWGYAACPDLSGHRVLASLLPLGALGLSLTAAGQFVPEHTTAALVVHHPEARYFAVREVG